MPKHFFETINLSTEQLQKATARALAQEELIKEIFKANPGKKFSPSQLHKLFIKKYQRTILLTSIRRSLSNLSHKKHGRILVKTDEQVMGVSGMPEKCWMLNDKTDDKELQEWWNKYQNGDFDGSHNQKQAELF